MSNLLLKNATYGLNYPVYSPEYNIKLTEIKIGDDLENLERGTSLLELTKTQQYRKVTHYRASLKRARLGLVDKSRSIIRIPSGITLIAHAQMGYATLDIGVVKLYHRCLNPGLRMIDRRKRRKFGDKIWKR